MTEIALFLENTSESNGIHRPGMSGMGGRGGLGSGPGGR